jgi:plasmid stabilization system protein ParE
MAFRVSVSAKAKRDLDGILAWLLAEEAGETGLRWFQGLKNALASLANLPERCPLAPENRHKPHTYRILFTIEADIVTILHVRHGRRRRLSH